MRKEIYEQYKKDCPEELLEIAQTFAYTKRVEARRAALRKAKHNKIDEWRKRLNGNDYAGRSE